MEQGVIVTNLKRVRELQHRAYVLSKQFQRNPIQAVLFNIDYPADDFNTQANRNGWYLQQQLKQLEHTLNDLDAKVNLYEIALKYLKETSELDAESPDDIFGGCLDSFAQSETKIAPTLFESWLSQHEDTMKRYYLAKYINLLDRVMAAISSVRKFNSVKEILRILDDLLKASNTNPEDWKITYTEQPVDNIPLNRALRFSADTSFMPTETENTFVLQRNSIATLGSDENASTYLIPAGTKLFNVKRIPESTQTPEYVEGRIATSVKSKVYSSTNGEIPSGETDTDITLDTVISTLKNYITKYQKYVNILLAYQITTEHSCKITSLRDKVAEADRLAMFVLKAENAAKQIDEIGVEQLQMACGAANAIAKSIDYTISLHVHDPINITKTNSQQLVYIDNNKCAIVNVVM